MLLVYYLYSIIFFAILDFGIINMFSYTLWYRMNEIEYVVGNNQENRHSDVFIFFFAFAMPIIRLCVTCMYIYLATCSDEEFDRLLDNLKKIKYKK